MTNRYERLCKTDCKDNNGNCPIPSSDNLPVQCVGPWVENKYFFLERYLNASCEARKKFADQGNAVFIDLFSGPGKCVIRDEKKEIDSGGTRALNRDRASFNEYFFFDISEENVEALRKRISENFHCHIKCGDSNILVTELVEELLEKKYRYHFAFVDPFGPDGLKFNTLKELAKLNRMDMLIHFPIGAIKRNIKIWVKNKNTILDELLGTDIWRKDISSLPSNQIYEYLIDIFKKQLMSIGYPEEGLKIASSDSNIYRSLPAVSIKNIKKVNLYVLIFASKHELGQKLWNSIIKASPDRQQTFF